MLSCSVNNVYFLSLIRLLKVRGQVQFLMSPDHTKAVVLQEDINLGHYSLTVIDNEAILDPASSAMVDEQSQPITGDGNFAIFILSNVDDSFNNAYLSFSSISKLDNEEQKWSL